ncbi:carbohydrate ABC transporter permease [Amphibacillus sp. Q70]|uniref:carbohydrate ABC transporter permease n=1 Tax=Amphibacillus sp. Q70 TaxID=3453416 RepID=UPI003F84A993
MNTIKRRINQYMHFIFIAPSFLFITLLGIIPLLYAVYLSFRNYQLTMTSDMSTFNGFGNYVTVLTNGDFLQSILWTLIFTAFAVIIPTGIGLFISVLLTETSQSKFVRVLKSFLILPMMIAPVVSSTIWKILFGAVYGPINYIIDWLGGTSIAWTGEALPAKIAIIIIDSWGAIPFCMLIFLGALTTIPNELYESARIDGASDFTSFRKITLPLMRNFIALVVSIRIMDSLKVFDPVMILTQGGPGNATETMGTMIYKMAFRYMNVGEGSAAAIIFFVIIAIVSIGNIKLMRRKKV